MKIVRNFTAVVGIFFMFSFGIFAPVHAAGAVDAYFFYGNGCPHCAKEEVFLTNVLQKEYPDLRIHSYEIYDDEENARLLREIAQTLGAKVSGVPFFVVGDEYFIGYAEGVTGVAIQKKVADCFAWMCTDTIAAIAGVSNDEAPEEPSDGPDKDENVPAIVEPVGEASSVPEDAEDAFVGTTSAGALDLADAEQTKDGNIVTVPLWGEMDALDLSLPVLTVVMGALDGFNPCAMWALLFLISLLLGMKDRRRMWILGSAFVVASAFVYFLFMAAWLNLFLFVGIIGWVRASIGLLALAGGLYSIREYVKGRSGTCKIEGNEKRQKIFARMKETVNGRGFWVALGGIVLLAFLVNLVELVCSAGLPAVYTQVLALNSLEGWQYYAYILLYIFFFMLDDLFVFFAAMITLEMTGITTKYAKVSRLAGGLIMCAIGVTLIFKPELLMFG